MHEMSKTPQADALKNANLPTRGLHAGLVFNIMRFSLHDGPGIRTTVFLKGCPLHCRWCHNPESQSNKAEVLYLSERCIRCGDCYAACRHGALDEQLHSDSARCQRCGECVEVCPGGARQLVGRSMTVEDVLAEVVKDQVFYEESGGGVTISGGEPLQQPDFVEALLAACKARKLHTVLDTCGFGSADGLRRVSEHVDLFFYDLKQMDSEKHKRFTGVSNELILQNLTMLASMGSAIRVRVPIIPGYNDDGENLEALSKYLSPLGLREIDLLPYHELGNDKYRRMNLASEMGDVAPPTMAEMEAIAARLRSDGFQVRIGD